MHICRKQMCDAGNLLMHINGLPVLNVQTLHVLGLTFSNNYRWKAHCLRLKNSLLTRVNFIQYVAWRSHAHISTIAYLTKMLVLSKIDYALIIYGNSCKSNINILKPVYHQAVRASCYAFRTTPISNIIIETGLPTLENRLYELKAKIVPKLLNSNKSILGDDVRKIIIAKKIPKSPSAIDHCLCIAKELNIPLKISRSFGVKPPWILKDCSFDISLSMHKKEDYVFRNLIAEKTQVLDNTGWNLLYTDGSKSPGLPRACAVVDATGRVLLNHIFHESTSTFITEARAILHAANLAHKNKLKTVIVTDSLSVLLATRNPSTSRWSTINKLRNIITTPDGKIKMLWVPSHIGLLGNEQADRAAKYAASAPLIMDDVMEKLDLQRYIGRKVKEEIAEGNLQYHHQHYSCINPQLTPPLYPTNVEKTKIQTFSRIRLGHTIATHQWILKKSSPPICCCGQTLTIKHILCDCLNFSLARSIAFGTINPLNILQSTSEQNINSIFYFINTTKLII
ncbi:uncharacterized protein ACN427_013880 [Glossina fuscipes fuscipes]